MDTPRTNLGDATYLGRPPPDFDMTQEPSFQSPSKDNNLLQQLRNGQGANIRTPRGSRAPLGEKRNISAGFGGSEFTPMLKSATRNRARRRGKENTNGLATPALGKIDEDMDMTNVPVESSLFGPSRNMSYADATALPEVEASSTTSTPMVLPTRRGGSKGPLQDGNQLSLREQENVIDKIEKENFGLKLKIHFLEEALRKTGPGFSEATVKENTELKVDKVTMQRELSKYKKHLASAEKDLEAYQQQILEVRERAKQKYAGQSQKAENDALQRQLEDRDAEIVDLKQQLEESQSQNDDKIAVQRELAEYKRDLESAERDLETYQQQLLDAQQEKTKHNHADQSQKTENDALRRRLEDQTAEAEGLRRQLHRAQNDDKAAMQEEISRYEKQLASAEKELGSYKQQISEAEKRAKKDYADQKAENDTLRRRLEEQGGEIRKYANQQTEIDTLRRRLREQDAEIERYADHNAENDALRRRIKEQDTDMQRYTDQKVENETLRRRLKERDVEIEDLKQLQQLQDNDREMRLRSTLTSETERHKGEEAALSRQIDDLRRDLEARQSALSSLRDEISTLRDSFRQSESKCLAQAEKIEALEDEVEVLQSTLDDESEDANERLRQADELCRDLERQLELSRREKVQQTDRLGQLEDANTITEQLRQELEETKQELHNAEEECESLQHQLELSQREIGRLGQLEDVNSIAEELRQQLEETKQSFHNAEQKCRALEHQLELSRRENVQQTGRLGQLEDASSVTEKLKQQLEETRQNLYNAEQECEDLQGQLERSKRENVQQNGRLGQLRDADSVAEKLRQQLNDADDVAGKLRQQLRESKQNAHDAKQKCEDLEHQLELSRRENIRQTDRLARLEAAERQLEETKQDLLDAEQECEDLRRELDLTKRENAQQTGRLGQLEAADSVAEGLRQQLENANRVANGLRQQLEEAKEDLQDAEQECEELKQKVDGASRQELEALTQANQASEDLGRQLLRAQKESKRAELLCEDLRSQLDTAKQDLDYINPLCKELRQKLDRARNERAAYQASAMKLEVDCERLKKGAQDALAWIQAKNAEQPTLIIPGPIKKATTTTFRYGDIVRDVVDQKDHEAVIRAANSAQRRHEKEIRGMALQMEWMQARWERESKLRKDGAFAKKFLQLRLDIADACNKADLRMLNRIHQDLGLKSTAELLAKRQKNRKPVNNLKVFVGVIRAVARMRIEARKWGEHEKTRQRLVSAWEEQKQNQVVCT